MQALLSIKELLHVNAQKLRTVTDIPQKEAMILLGKSLGKDMSWLITHSEELVVVDKSFLEDVHRRLEHEPLEYILGCATFYGKSFDVDKRVLIPRPETELLVDKVVELGRKFSHPHIVEIGCGSGIVSIMLALLLPDIKLSAVDISEDALEVSKHNAKKYGVQDRIKFVHGSYLDGIEDAIDMIVSNPPYIANNEPLDIGLSFEPSLALYGGSKGDEMLCHIIDLFSMRQAKCLVCEMGYDQRGSLSEYALSRGFKASFYKDLAGLDRGFWIEEEK